MRPTEQTEALIVGAGPTGLTLALELARREVPFCIIDRQAAGANTSRACVIHARTLEELEPTGVVPELLRRGIEVPVFRVRDRDRSLMTIDFRGLPTRFAYTLMLPQSQTEEVLLQGLHSHGVQVLRPAELLAVHENAVGAVAVIRDSKGERRIQAKRVIGCDGMHSRVREQAAIAFEGGAYEESFVLADIDMHWPIPRDEVTLFYSPRGLMVIAPIPGNRFRLVAAVSEAEASVSRDGLQNLLSSRGPELGEPALLTEIHWASRFQIHHRVSRRFHQGPVIVLGDAAHVHSPAGGQGMNTGIQDAVSLAAALCAGDPEASLESWASDRRKVAQSVVRLADRMTRAATLESRLAQSVRNIAVELLGRIPAARQVLAMKLSELDLRTGT